MSSAPCFLARLTATAKAFSEPCVRSVEWKMNLVSAAGSALARPAGIGKIEVFTSPN